MRKLTIEYFLRRLYKSATPYEAFDNLLNLLLFCTDHSSYQFRNFLKGTS
jgi:hypothetical protein